MINLPLSLKSTYLYCLSVYPSSTLAASAFIISHLAFYTPCHIIVLDFIVLLMFDKQDKTRSPSSFS